jgi:bifunctional non-homologous end joining protein LigD
VGPQVGELDERGVLRHRGRVEFGVTEDVVAALHERLGPLVRRTSPFGQRLNEPDATYLEPHLPAEIRYLERTSEGRLRHAAFRQLGGRWNH